MFKTAKTWLRSAGRPDGPARQGADAPDFIASRLARTVADQPAPPGPSPVETRAAVRFVPHATATALTLSGGRRVDARIINLSRLAVAVEAELSGIDPAAVVKVGARPVRQGRAIRRGMVFRFDRPLDPSVCRPTLIL